MSFASTNQSALDIGALSFKRTFNNIEPNSHKDYWNDTPCPNFFIYATAPLWFP